MKRLIEYSAANYIAVLIFIVLLTAVTGWFMPQLQIDVSSEGLMIADTPERAYGIPHDSAQTHERPGD